MLHAVSLIKNVGKFDYADAAQISPYEKLVLIYAENGRGKTTVSAILKSFASGEPEYILERKRLGSNDEPHIVIQSDKPSAAVFQNGAWSETNPDLFVFDDVFVAANVCSGIEVFSSHKKNLHELIIGQDGIELSNQLREEVAKIEEHNRKLREFGGEISGDERGPFTIEQFCSLKAVEDIDEQIKDAKRRLAAAHNASGVNNTPTFEAIALPQFDLPEISKTLSVTLKDIDSAALNQVKTHLSTLDKSGEIWVRQGLSHLDHDDETRPDCPFCGQDLKGSHLIDLYRQYFSDAYSELISDLKGTINKLEQTHSRDAPATFERLIRETVQRQSFWVKFTEIPDIDFDTAAISLTWKKVREAFLSLLKQKRAAPLDALEIDQNTQNLLAEYEKIRKQVTASSDEFLSVNSAIGVVKEQTSTADIATLQSDLKRKQSIKSRFKADVAKKCATYLEEKVRKKQTENTRKNIREKLDEHRAQAFPTYGEAINNFLVRFGARFRIGPVDIVNNRAGSSANYTLLINSETVTLASETIEPCFRNTLSAGDRNTLSLAFFFASLLNHADRGNLVVVLDDPMTSLDEHRRLMTLQEIDRLVRDVMQVIVLSHSKPFLFGVWQQCQQTQKSAHTISRSGQSSCFADWDVTTDMVTEHDRRYDRCMSYIQNASPEIERSVAESLRPMLERFIRVSYANEFKPGVLLGPFIGKCRDRLAQTNPILSQADTDELRMVLDYANRFHHVTNPAYATEIINDAELLGFTKRTINFMRRG